MISTPVPAEQKAHSERLSKRIQATIEAKGGSIGFDEFMQLALYAPGMGYYAAGLTKFGAAGDFITAPEMGDLFGQCLAPQVHEVFSRLDRQIILEFGAGSGALAATLLNELAGLDALPSEYLILEVSGELRARQLETLSRCAPELLARVKWLDRLPDEFEGVVLANEVLDAMPVKIFEQDQAGMIYELGVETEKSDEAKDTFCWQRRVASEQLTSAVQSLELVLDGHCYRSELHDQANAWISSLAKVVHRGVVMLIDYGFPRAEYYHADRHMGTVMCHYRHHSHDNPFYMPGLQDITAHVDFTAIAKTAKSSGFELAGYTTQAAFLLSAGLLDKIASNLSLEAQIALSQEVKKLTMPHEMGELFKVLALSKGYSFPLSGFAQQNNLYRLEESD